MNCSVPGLLFVALCTLSACKSDEETIPNNSTLDLSSQFYTDVNGNPTGQQGTPEDFGQEAWEKWERELFTPLDTAALPQSDATADSINTILLIPNPAQDAQSLLWSPGDTVNLKLVMVDAKRQPLLRISRTTYKNVALNYNNIAHTTDSLYRIYFAFSTAARPYFYTSHADVTVRH